MLNVAEQVMDYFAKLVSEGSVPLAHTHPHPDDIMVTPPFWLLLLTTNPRRVPC